MVTGKESGGAAAVEIADVGDIIKTARKKEDQRGDVPA
jgi:hypothetical protein